MYCRFYGFSAKPFENTPDPDFLFLSKNHREVLASLTYGINAGKGFMLVVGDVGTGKTTLIHALIKQIDPHFLIIHTINPKSNFQEILHHISRKLDISPEGLNDLELFEVISEKLIALDKDVVRMVLIIDEAHHLSKEALEEIRLISNIESEKKKLIQIALVGQIELYQTLNSDALRQLKQRIVLNRSLRPLSKKETFEYVQHRLNVAGRRDQLFSREALNLIWRKSKGIPRVINLLCDNALIIGLALEATTIGRKIVREAIQEVESGSELLKGMKRLSFLNWKTVGALAAFAGVLLLAQFWNSGYLERGPEVYSSRTLITDNTERKEAKAPIQAMMEDKDEVNNKESKEPRTTIQAAVEKRVEVNDAGQTDLFLKSEELDIPEYVVNLDDKPQGDRKIVKPREYLAKIAISKYRVANDTIFDLIQMANPKIRDVDLIYANQQILLPHIRRKDLIVKDGKGNYYIHYASFCSFGSTLEEIQALKSKNQKAFLFTAMMGKELVYRIYIGVFENYSEAEKEVQKIDFKHLPFLSKLPPQSRWLGRAPWPG
jgi:general secretion pathway protein A